MNCHTTDISPIWILYGFQADALEPIRFKNMMQVIYDTRPHEFQNSLFLRPEAGKDNIWTGSSKDGFCLFGTHRMADKTLFYRADTLDVQAARTVADETADSLPAMTDAEVDIGMLRQIGFAVLVIGETGLAINAKADAKPSQQFNIPYGTLSPTLQVFKPQSRLASPFGQRSDESLRLCLAQVLNVIVDAEDFPAYGAHRICISQCKGTGK